MSCVRLSSADCSPRVDVQVPAGAAGGHRHGSYQCVIPGPGLVPTCRRPIITQALQSGSVLQTQAFLFPTSIASEKVKEIKSNGNLFVEPHNCRYLILLIVYCTFSFSHPDPEPRTQPGLDQKQGHVGDQDTHLRGKYGGVKLRNGSFPTLAILVQTDYKYKCNQQCNCLLFIL